MARTSSPHRIVRFNLPLNWSPRFRRISPSSALCGYNSSFRLQATSDHYAEMPTFSIHNFGCRATQADADAIEGALVSRGYHRLAADHLANLVVLNTCTV